MGGFVEEAFNELLSKVLIVRSRPSVEGWTRLLEDVERIKAHIIHILTIKLQICDCKAVNVLKSVLSNMDCSSAILKLRNSWVSCIFLHIF